MIKLIIEKELREMIHSTKFAVTFGVCAILILLTFYVGAKNHVQHKRHYEAALVENFRKMEGLTDWLRVNSHRIFLPPRPLETLVTGISNDIGRTINVYTGGELGAVDSRYGDDPIFAVFNFLDFNFLFQIVLSLFAILFAFDAINGEKERGTLRLSFAGAIPKDKFILGKLIGSFLALGIPLLIPIILGCLMLTLIGVHLTGEEWLRLGLIVLTGLIFFGVFLTLSMFVSGLTQHSSHSFLVLLVIWILSVFIIPRTATLLAGRVVDVTSVDQLAYQKERFRAQLWQEDIKKISNYKPATSADMQAMMNEFQKFMQDLSDERERKMNEYASRLNENRASQQLQQQRLALGLSRISPATLFTLASTNLAATTIGQKQHFLSEAKAYQQTYRTFMKEKTGIALGSGAMIIKMDPNQEAKPINPHELPEFEFHTIPLKKAVYNSLFDIGLLLLFMILFFIGSFVSFLKYDMR